MALVLRNAALQKQVSLLKCMKTRTVVTTAKQNNQRTPLLTDEEIFKTDGWTSTAEILKSFELSGDLLLVLTMAQLTPMSTVPKRSYSCNPCSLCGPCCLPPPCSTPPRCNQCMTGYYYYPYGTWFCGPYHNTQVCKIPQGACCCATCLAAAAEVAPVFNAASLQCTRCAHATANWSHQTAQAHVARCAYAPLQAAPLQLQAAPLRAAPLQAAPLQAAPLQAASSRTAPLQAAPLQAAPSQAAPSQAAPLRAAPLQAAAAQTATAQAGSGQAATAQAGSAQAGTAQAGSAQAGTAQAGTGQGSTTQATAPKAAVTQAALPQAESNEIELMDGYVELIKEAEKDKKNSPKSDPPIAHILEETKINKRMMKRSRNRVAVKTGDYFLPLVDTKKWLLKDRRSLVDHSCKSR